MFVGDEVKPKICVDALQRHALKLVKLYTVTEADNISGNWVYKIRFNSLEKCIQESLS